MAYLSEVFLQRWRRDTADAFRRSSQVERQSFHPKNFQQKNSSEALAIRGEVPNPGPMGPMCHQMIRKTSPRIGPPVRPQPNGASPRVPPVCEMVKKSGANSIPRRPPHQYISGRVCWRNPPILWSLKKKLTEPVSLQYSQGAWRALVWWSVSSFSFVHLQKRTSQLRLLQSLTSFFYLIASISAVSEIELL